MYFKCVLIVAALAACGCVKSEMSDERLQWIEEHHFLKNDDSEAIRLLSWLDSSDPQADFEQAVKAKEHRFIGVYGFSVSVPLGRSSEGYLSIRCLDLDDIRAIDGTSDAVLSFRHKAYMAQARIYAEEFNWRMKMYLETFEGFQCGTYK